MDLMQSGVSDFRLPIADLVYCPIGRPKTEDQKPMAIGNRQSAMVSLKLLLKLLELQF
jgi:hypothetical protein